MPSRLLPRALAAGLLAAMGPFLLPALAQPKTSPDHAESHEVVTPSGLKYTDLRLGQGDAADTGKVLEVNYSGWLENGVKFDSSIDRRSPFSSHLGGGQVIRGWDEGVAGMHVGGKRRLTIPASLGYGARGAGGVIPPNATLIFEVELLGLK